MDTCDLVKKYRKKQKLSQSEFSKKYNIPLSTLRKWEQKESRPSKFFIELINKEMSNDNLLIIEGKDKYYTYDSNTQIVYDISGTGIKVSYDISKINKENLLHMLDQLFDDYNKMIEKFVTVCILENEGNTKWEPLK